MKTALVCVHAKKVGVANMKRNSDYMLNGEQYGDKVDVGLMERRHI